MVMNIIGFITVIMNLPKIILMVLNGCLQQGILKSDELNDEKFHIHSKRLGISVE